MRPAQARPAVSLSGGGLAIGAALLVAAGSAATAAEPVENGLARCAAITARDDRLACYDELAAPSAVSAPASAPAAPPARVAPAAAIAPTAPVAAATAPAAPATPSTPPPAASPSSSALSERPEDFGLSPLQRGVQETRLASISARVLGFARATSGSILVVLDNGQSWELDTADPLLAAGDAVTIRRASLGSFLMNTPTGRSHRVRRIH